MKKIFTFLFLLLIPIIVVFAKDDSITLSVNGKTGKNIKVEEKFKLKVTYNSKNINPYAFLTKLDYDKDVLELKDVKGLNNFEVTSGEVILADRIDLTKGEKQDIIELTFKVKKPSKTTIALKGIKVANAEKEIQLEDVKIDVSSGSISNNYIIYAAIGIVLIGGLIIIFKKKKA